MTTPKINQIVLIVLTCLFAVSLFYNMYTMHELHRSVDVMKGKMEVLDEVRATVKVQQQLFEKQIDINSKQITAFEKIDSTLGKSLELYGENLQLLKKKQYEKINSIPTYSSSQLKSYFASLPPAW